MPGFIHANQVKQRLHHPTRTSTVPEGEDAAIVGHFNDSGAQVLLHTELGGQRILEELEDDPLPRIC